MDTRLILFFDTLWGAPLGMPGRLPAGFAITTDRLRFAEADAVVFHIPEWRYGIGPHMPRKPAGQLWVAWSMESEAAYPLLANREFIGHFDLAMTYRLDADVPVTYVDPRLARALRRPVRPKPEQALVAAFLSGGWDGNGRREYLRELARCLHVDSYGGFLRNRTLAVDRGAVTKRATIARYRFTLAFENACARDYVTEKFFDPLVAGSVPVYMGAPNVGDFAPGANCYLDTRDFPDPAALAAHLRRLAADEEAYGAHLAWKREPYRAAFRDMLRRARPHPFVRLCDRLRERWGDQPASAPEGASAARMARTPTAVE